MELARLANQAGGLVLDKYADVRYIPDRMVSPVARVPSLLERPKAELLAELAYRSNAEGRFLEVSPMTL